MRKYKISVYLLSIILIFIMLLDFNTAFAQQSIRIDEVIPNQGSPGQEIRLELRGGGFDNLERLIGVRISGVELEFWDYVRFSDEHIEVAVFIPEQTPLGQTEIRFIFEQVALDAFFIVTQPERREAEPPAINQITPQEGRVDTDIRLSLRGNFLYELGELAGVNIAGMDVPFWDYQVASDQSATVWIYLPLELPAERTGIALFYGNYSFEDRFTVTEVTEVTPPGNGFSTIFIIFIAIAVVIAVVVVVRIARGRKPPEKDLDEKPDRPQPKIDFKVEVDPGRQSVESTRPSHDMALEIEFKIDVDPGVQSIESKETPLIDDDATLLSR
jgi:hypothetical protein